MQCLVDMLQYLCNVRKHQVLSPQTVNLRHALCRTSLQKEQLSVVSAICLFCSLVVVWNRGKLQGI